MAKKRKGRRRSRRVGAMNPKSPIIKIAAIAAGYLMGDTINAQVIKMVPATQLTTVNSVLPYAETGIGALLLLKGKPSLVKTAVGGVLAGAGLKLLLKKFGVITGYQSTPVIGRRAIRGYQSVPVIGANPVQLSGQPPVQANTPSQLSGPGYGVNGFQNIPGYQPNGSGVMGSLFTNADPGSGLNHDYTGYMNG
jgi:hypothetical protein